MLLGLSGGGKRNYRQMPWEKHSIERKTRDNFKAAGVVPELRLPHFYEAYSVPVRQDPSGL